MINPVNRHYSWDGEASQESPETDTVVVVDRFWCYIKAINNDSDTDWLAPITNRDASVVIFSVPRLDLVIRSSFLLSYSLKAKIEAQRALVSV